MAYVVLYANKYQKDGGVMKTSIVKKHLNEFDFLRRIAIKKM